MEKLGKYEIRSVLGRGAMGTVYEGWDAIISRRVAIKTVRLPDTDDSEEREMLGRFQQEAQAAGRLHHPNVVGVFDYAETNELAYIVMEFVAGQTLKAVVERPERPDLVEVGRLMNGLLTGLAYSHSHGVIHRDIKPANVIVTPAGEIKIADFGIARIESSTMTQLGTIMGTPAYMSPEQFQGVSIDSRTDIYSAGIVLYQLLTGKRPFEGSMATIMHAVLNSSAPRPSDIEPGVPPVLDDIVARAIARSPDDRYPDAAAFNKALQAALVAPPGLDGGSADTASPGMGHGLGDLLDEDEGTVIQTAGMSPAKPERAAGVAAGKGPAIAAERSSRLPLVLAAVGLLVLLGGGGAYLLFGRAAKPPPQQETASNTPQAQAGSGAAAGQQASNSPVAPAGDRPVSPPASQQQATQPAPSEPMRQPATPTLPPTPASPPTTATLPPQRPPATNASTTTTSPVQSRPDQSRPDQSRPDQSRPDQSRPTTTPEAANVTPEPVRPPPQPGDQPSPATTVGPTTPSTTTPTQVVPRPADPPNVLAFAQPSPEASRAAIAAAISGTSCAFATGEDGPNGPTLRGATGPNSGGTSLHEMVQDAAPNLAFDWQVASVDARFCQLLDLLGPLARPFGSTARAVTVTLADNRTDLVAGDVLLPRVVMPEGPGYLQLDYVSSDGSVLHMHSSKPAPPYPTGATPAFGDPKPGSQRWAIDEPFGTDLVIAISTTTPLFRPAQALPDTIDAYLRDLRAALVQAKRNNGRVSAAVLPVRTRAAP